MMGRWGGGPGGMMGYLSPDVHALDHIDGRLAFSKPS